MSDDAVPDLRASDAERDRVAEILRDALAEGRLDMEEFDERLEAAYKGRPYAELAPLTRRRPAPSHRLFPSPSSRPRRSTAVGRTGSRAARAPRRARWRSSRGSSARAA